MKVKYVRLYADGLGDSHFEDLEEELKSADFAPPAPPLSVSDLKPAIKTGFVSAPSGWVGDWHPSPARNLFFVLNGDWDVEASDGEIRRFGAGSILLVEDTTGKGHASRVVSKTASLMALVQVSD